MFEILVVPVCDFLNRKRQFFNVQLVRYGYQLTVYQNKAGLRIRSKIPEPARKVHLYTYVYNYRYVFGLGEELHEAAVREVFEETGISTKFKSIVAFRQAAQFSARLPPPPHKKSAPAPSLFYARLSLQ